MKLYHGSNVEVREPKILEPSHSLDFGPGFYTTLNRDQAVDFVCSCRDGFNAASGRDFVFGPVANDDVYRTLTLYREGEISKGETLARLKVKRLYNQLVFATAKALAFIRFVRSEVVA